MFFDDYERFFKTSRVFSNRDRLNLRHEAIFEANRDVLQGARVLDIAAHDGRWSFAALRAGAAHVTGIEARPELVDHARETFSYYGEDPGSYTFICGDVFDVLGQETNTSNNSSRYDLGPEAYEFISGDLVDGRPEERVDVDVILCLGFLYHTYRHTELLHYIRGLDPTYLIVDTYVVSGVEQPFVKLLTDRPDNQGKAILDPYGHAQRTIVGRPSVPALRMMLRAYDFEVEQMYDWGELLAAHPTAEHVNDYRDGWRVTVRGRSAHAESTAVRSRNGGTRSARSTPGRARPPQQVTPIRPRQGPPASPAASGGGWRHWVNRGLAMVTGYELRRVGRGRG